MWQVNVNSQVSLESQTQSSQIMSQVLWDKFNVVVDVSSLVQPFEKSPSEHNQIES